MHNKVSCTVTPKIKNQLETIARKEGISQGEVLRRGIDIQYNKRFEYTSDEVKHRLSSLDDILTIVAYTNVSELDKIHRIMHLCEFRDLKSGYCDKK